MRETDPDRGREIDAAFAQFDPAVLDQPEPIRASAADLYAAVPKYLLIEDRHREVGTATHIAIKEANPGDPGTRGFAYHSDDPNLQAKARMGWIVEAAFREALGYGCTCSRVNHAGRVEHKPDTELLGWHLDVKWTSTRHFFVSRKQAEHRHWYFIGYRSDLLADTVTLHGAAFGADFHSDLAYSPDWDRGRGESLALPSGFVSVEAP